MNAITPSQVSKQLDIQPSTLRKYSLLIEENGIEFERNANNSRRYSDMDVVTLQKMITLIKVDGVSVENAAFAISKWRKGESSVASGNDDVDNAIERRNDDIAAALIGEIRGLKEKIEEQERTIDSFRIAQEKRDTYFVEILENLQGEIHRLNERQVLPEPEPEVAAALEHSPQVGKRGFFARLFNK